MRRTWNTSVLPAIGIVVAGTGKIGFGPACAAAGSPFAAAPVSARAPVASTLLRSTLFMKCPLSCSCFLPEAYLASRGARDKTPDPALAIAGPLRDMKERNYRKRMQKRPAVTRAFFDGGRGPLPFHIR